MSTDETTENTAASNGAEAAAETPQEAQRRKFREALEKKNAGARGGGSVATGGNQKGPSGPAKQQRMHRRKSG